MWPVGWMAAQSPTTPPHCVSDQSKQIQSLQVQQSGLFPLLTSVYVFTYVETLEEIRAENEQTALTVVCLSPRIAAATVGLSVHFVLPINPCVKDAAELSWTMKVSGPLCKVMVHLAML